MKLKLIRFASIDNSGVFGELYFGEKRFCFTKERLWRQNKKNISCIPDGNYICKKVNSSFGLTLEITGVPNRTALLFHYGNYLRSTKGCVLIGGGAYLNPKKRDGEILLTATKYTMEEFAIMIKRCKVFKLEVASPWKWEV